MKTETEEQVKKQNGGWRKTSQKAKRKREKNKSKGKTQIANGKSERFSMSKIDNRNWKLEIGKPQNASGEPVGSIRHRYGFAFCDLRFDF